MVTVRNKRTGEFRDVDEAELIQLKKEITSAGFPMWEQTSYAHAQDVQELATYGALLEHHMGEDVQKILKHEALVLDAEGVGPEVNPHLQLTPGEIEEGLTPEAKLEHLRQQYAPSVPTREDLIAKAHETIAPGEVKTPRKLKSRGQRSRAGGSEDIREQAEAIAGEDGNDAGEESAGDETTEGGEE